MLLLAKVPAGASDTLRSDQVAYRELFRELVETNTTLSAGSCTDAAARTRDPFTLVEENGCFYARGVADDKAMASVWVDTFVRFLQDGFKPRRTLRIALTCGEETNGAFNGAQYLSTGQRDLIDAEFAVNEGAWGTLDENGHKVMMSAQAGEKASQNYQLEVRNPLTRMAELKGGDMGAAMRALVQDPTDASATATVTADPTCNAMLRTTCVATMLDGGHATNALPQRARANVNCPIYPDQTFADVRQDLERAVADPEVKVTTLATRGPMAKAPSLTPQITGPIQQVAAQIYPGVPVLPLFQAGATDGQFLGAAGIPTYGIGATLFDPDLGGIHGLNERIRTRSFGAEFHRRSQGGQGSARRAAVMEEEEGGSPLERLDRLADQAQATLDFLFARIVDDEHDIVRVDHGFVGSEDAGEPGLRP